MTELVQFLFLIALGGIIWNLRRDAPQTPMILWTWAWVVVVTATFVVDEFEDRALAGLFISLFPAFLLAGSLSYVYRPVPRWLLPAAIAVGGVRVVLSSAELAVPNALLALVFAPTLAFLGGVILYSSTRDSDSIVERLLPFSLILLGVNQAVVSILELSGLSIAPFIRWSWIIAAPATIAIQVLGCHRWMRQRSRREQAAQEDVQRALDSSEIRFRALTENSSQLILELDSGGRIEYANPRVGELLGLGPDLLQGRRLSDFIHADDRGTPHADGTADATPDGGGHHVRRWRRSDGESSWVESVTRAFPDSDGQTHWVVSAADVTERRALEFQIRRSQNDLETRVEERTAELAEAVRRLEREGIERSGAEEALRLSEERFRAVSELSSDWNYLFYVDEDGQVSGDRALGNLARITGYTPEQLLEMPYLDLVVPKDRERVRKDFQMLLVPGESNQIRVVECPHGIRTASDEIRWLHTVVRVENAPDGGIRVIGAASDVTEQKLAEEERRRLETHLRDVQRLESLGVLSDRIAHGFNNQLTVILGNSSLALMDVEKDTPLYERLQRIRSAAQQSSSLTEQMLVYAGTATPSLKSIHLPHLVEAIRELLEASMSRHCNLQLDVVSPLPLMEGDEGQLQQVAINLITNASEARSRNSGTVWLRAGSMYADQEYLDDTFGSPHLAAGTYIYLEVEDDGSGISPADRGKIFEPFFSTRFSGRGLGLAAVLGIVQSHRGAIKLRSEPGRGTCVRALFPISDRDSIPAKARTPKGDIEGRVLVVDDDDAVRELMAELLARAGFEVLAAANGGEAVERMRAAGDGISVVVLDIDMPGVDGGEALREIRNIRQDVPVVVVSGYDEGEITRRIGDQKVSGLVRKPFDEQLLSETILDALQHAHD